MSGDADELRAKVAAELTDLLAYDGPLSPTGSRSTVMQPQNFRRADLTPARRELWRDLRGHYLARQHSVTREGRAALLTPGVPGAGRSRAVDQLGVDEGWRRLDADVVKDYLIEDLVGRLRRPAQPRTHRRAPHHACRTGHTRPRGVPRIPQPATHLLSRARREHRH